MFTLYILVRIVYRHVFVGDYEFNLVIRVYISAVWLQNSTRKTNGMGAIQL